jgi:hypothetical protein
MTTLRAQLATELAAALPPRKFRVVGSLGTIDKITKPTIQLEQTDIERAPAARGVALVTMRVHVITHREGVTPAADDAVDAIGVEVFEALASIPFANPTRGEKQVYKDTNLAYVITTQILTKRSTP